MTEPDHWQRLHPLSPVVRGGRATIALAIVILPSLAAGRDGTPQFVELGVVVLLIGFGFVSWLVTRWCIEGDHLRIETGVLRRQSLRFPLAQVQAIDIVRPGLARIVGLAELRLRMGGASGTKGRLAYLAQAEAESLRDRLLALAGGAASAGVEAAPEQPHDGRTLVAVPTPRLVASILVSDVGIVAEAVLVALLVTAILSPAVAVAVITGGAAWLIAVATLVWRRFNQEYKLRVTETAGGLHLAGGLVALTAETIRPGRVQAVRMVEPFVWRLIGWCRLEVDLAGRQRSKGEGREASRQLRAVLPVGSRADARPLLDRLLFDAPYELAPAPRRARWKSPLRFRMIAWARTESCVATRSGRLRRVTCWVPVEKVQSFRRVQGPVQRRLQLASVHVDTAGRSVHAVIRDRDAREADKALGDLVELARQARRRPGVQSAVQAG